MFHISTIYILFVDNEVIEEDRTGRWPTSWFTQYYMLSWRSYKQTKGLLKQGYAIIQTLIISLVVGVIYWQIELNVHTIRDVMGLVSYLPWTKLHSDFCGCIYLKEEVESDLKKYCTSKMLSRI